MLPPCFLRPELVLVHTLAALDLCCLPIVRLTQVLTWGLEVRLRQALCSCSCACAQAERCRWELVVSAFAGKCDSAIRVHTVLLEAPVGLLRHPQGIPVPLRPEGKVVVPAEHPAGGLHLAPRREVARRVRVQAVGLRVVPRGGLDLEGGRASAPPCRCGGRRAGASL